MTPKYIVPLLAIVFVTGCSTVAPQYQASFENVQSLKEGGSSTVAVDDVTHEGGGKKVNHLTIRAGKFSSPYNDSYTAYLKKALEQELYDAERYSQDSSTRIQGVLLENEIDASGFSVGTSHMKARIIVSKNGNELFNKVVSADHQWESHFVDAIAIPKAVEEYGVVVQKLLGKLYADEDFIAAIK